MATVQRREEQVVLISEPIDRDRWLAGEIDDVEIFATAELASLSRRLNQILAGVLGVFLTTLSTLLTLVLSGAVN